MFLLSEQLTFPPAEWASEDGVVAVGGDLDVDRLLLAYSKGIFPWPHDGLPLMWFSPDPRMVLLPRDLHLSRSLRARLRQGVYDVRFDTDFRGVIERCAAAPRPDQEGTWITPEIIEAYCGLHELGLAHSAEAWRDGELVGGLYGVSLGKTFFGESMFALASDASKVALAGLAARLADWGFRMIDCQTPSEHLASLGAVEWSRRRFLAALDESLAHPTRQGCWSS